MKYIIWLKDSNDNVPECYSVGRKWVPNGDGPVTSHTAELIAKEIQSNMTRVRIVPCGQTPLDL